MSKSPLTGMFFLVLERDVRAPVVIRVDGMLCVPVFRTPMAAGNAQRWFHIPPSRGREITDGDKFWEAFHHDFRIVLDPRIVDGQCRYDEVEVIPDPKEVS
jgi:hypothetical protein